MHAPVFVVVPPDDMELTQHPTSPAEGHEPDALPMHVSPGAFELVNEHSSDVPVPVLLKHFTVAPPPPPSPPPLPPSPPPPPPCGVPASSGPPGVEVVVEHSLSQAAHTAAFAALSHDALIEAKHFVSQAMSEQSHAS
jgi:hypothetical protein